MKSLINPDTSGFGCKTVCFVKTNGDLCFETDKSERQKKIMNELVKGECYKYTYDGLNSPIYIGRYLRTNDNRSFFQEDNGKEICIAYSTHTLIYFMSVISQTSKKHTIFEKPAF